MPPGLLVTVGITNTTMKELTCNLGTPLYITIGTGDGDVPDNSIVPNVLSAMDD